MYAGNVGMLGAVEVTGAAVIVGVALGVAGVVWIVGVAVTGILAPEKFHPPNAHGIIYGFPVNGLM